MNDMEEWRERVRDIRATSTTWWWWWWSRPDINRVLGLHYSSYSIHSTPPSSLDRCNCLFGSNVIFKMRRRKWISLYFLIWSATQTFLMQLILSVLIMSEAVQILILSRNFTYPNNLEKLRFLTDLLGDSFDKNIRSFPGKLSWTSQITSFLTHVIFMVFFSL